MAERPTEEELAAAVTRAENLTRAATEESPENSGCWGNNLYILFVELRKNARNPDVSFKTTYLCKAEALGHPWQDFLLRNEALLHELDSALTDLEILQDIEQLVIDLSFSGARIEDIRAFEKRFDETLGFKAISIPIYRTLNPLLKKAAAALREVGIDPFKLDIATAK